jgi:hypothetical protein
MWVEESVSFAPLHRVVEGTLVHRVRIRNQGAIASVLTLFITESRFIDFVIRLRSLLLPSTGLDVVRYATTGNLEHAWTVGTFF